MMLVRGRLALCGTCLCILTLTSCVESKNTLVQGLTLKGFEQQGPLTIYNGNNLFDYINGEADIYFPFGFNLLYKQTYHKKKMGILITVDIYEMKTPRGAQGIFDKFTEEEDSFIDGLADTAYADGFVLLLKKGRYFIRIMPRTFVDDAVKASRGDLLDIGHALDRVLTSARRQS